MILQAAALPLLEGKICLVTSRNGSRWVIPKGCLEPGKTEIQIALQEAWEEAGLTGQPSKTSIGCYGYRKWGEELSVAVFRLDVEDVAEDWPERTMRQRIWLEPAKAIERLSEADLKDLVLKAIGK